MTTFEFILTGIAIGVAQIVIVRLSWKRGFDTATRAAKQRTAVLLKELQDLHESRVRT